MTTRGMVQTCVYILQPNCSNPTLLEGNSPFFFAFFSFFLSHRVWSAHPAKDGTAMAILEMEGMEGGAGCLL